VFAQMFRESPLLIMPLVALLLFFAMFVGVVVLFMTKSKNALDPIASLPLNDDESPSSSPTEVSNVR
jgi:hypothetical protein